MPAPTFDQQAGASSTTSTSPTVSFGSNPPAGATVIASAHHDTSSVTSVTGLGATWALIADISGYSVWQGKNCGGSSKVVTFHYAANPTNTAMKVVSFAGCDTAAPLDVYSTSVSVGGSGGVYTGTWTCTPDYPNVAVLALYSITTAGGVIPDTSMTGDVTNQLTAQTGGTYSVDGAYLLSTTGNGTLYTVNERWVNGGGGELYGTDGGIFLALKGAPSAQSHKAVTMAAASPAFNANGINLVPVNPLPLEVRVYPAATPNGAAIAIWEGQRGLRCLDPWNQTGTASLVMSLADPKATTTTLTPYNLVRVFVGKFDIFDFWMETPEWHVASPNGKSEEYVTVAGRGFESYLARAIAWTGGRSYSAVSAGYIMRDLITDAQSRGAVSLLGRDFTDSVDSAGVAWPTALNSLTLQFAEGRDYLACLNDLRQAGVWARLRSDFVLQMWGTDPGRDLSSAVIFREGRHLGAEITWRQQFAGAANVMLAKGITAYGSATDVSGLLPDRFEAFVQGPQSDDSATLNQVATSEISKRYLAGDAVSMPILHGMDPGSIEPYRHFRPGDYPAIHVPGTFDRAKKVVASILIESADLAQYTATIDLSALSVDPAVKIAQAVAKLVQPT